jgi:hypothetical protein
MTKTYNRPVHTAMAALSLVFKAPRTTYELSELLEARPDQIRQAMKVAEAEGLVVGGRIVVAHRISPPSIVWRKAD